MRPDFLASIGVPTPQEVEALRRGKTLSKGKPQVVERAEKRNAKQSAEDAWRDAIWLRDGGVSRASGKPVYRAHTDNRKRGECAHLDARSTSPEKKYDERNGVLLTAEEHALSDARTAPGGKALLEIKGKNANKALTFIRRDTKGRVLWTRTSKPEKAS